MVSILHGYAIFIEECEVAEGDSVRAPDLESRGRKRVVSSEAATLRVLSVRSVNPSTSTDSVQTPEIISVFGTALVSNARWSLIFSPGHTTVSSCAQAVHMQKVRTTAKETASCETKPLK